MLDRTQEAVRLYQRLAVRAAHVAALRQHPQSIQSGGRTQRLVTAAVHQLQQLHGELDVTQAARAALDLPVPFVRPYAVDDAPPHRPYVLDRLRALRGMPDQRTQDGQPLLAERDVAGRRTGLEQRLKLPRPGPPLVIGLVRGQCPHQRAPATLGPQVGVHRPRGLAADLHHARRDHLRLGQILILGADEDDVDITDIVEFPATAFTHGDDGQPGRPPAFGLSEAQRDTHRRVGQPGQPGHRHLDVHRERQVGRGHLQQCAAVRGAQLRR